MAVSTSRMVSGAMPAPMPLRERQSSAATIAPMISVRRRSGCGLILLVHADTMEIAPLDARDAVTLIYDTYITRLCDRLTDMPARSAAMTRRVARQPRPRGSPRAESLTEQAYRLIEEQIVTLRLKPGDILSEQMLSASFTIGRTPIREALPRLS